MPTHLRVRPLDLTCTALFAGLMILCSWIALPFPVPFTLQTFALFAALLTLGGRLGVYSTAVYLLLGAVGFPVFSGFRSGPGVLFDVTGGYLWGMLAAALLFWALTTLLGDTPTVRAVACLLGLLLCYGLGTAWLMVLYTESASLRLSAALGAYVLPYVLPDLLKLYAAALLSRRLRPLRGRISL